MRDVDIFNIPVHPAADLFPLLSGDEMEALVQDIQRNGLLEPVVTWQGPNGNGPVLLDGRNRREACRQLGLTPATREYTGVEPVAFICSQNVVRRHLDAGQRHGIGWKLLPHFTAEIAEKERQRKAARAMGRRQPDGTLGSLTRPKSADSGEPGARARDLAARAVGGRAQGISEYGRLEREAPDLAEKVLKGELKQGRAERIRRDRIAAAEREKRDEQKAAVLAVGPRVELREGDFRVVLADLENVDAIITDPPYGKEHLPLLEALAGWADGVLAPDGVLAVLYGQFHLPDAYKLLGTGRPYRWTGCYLATGAGYAAHDRRVQSQWKPVLIYGGGERFHDVITAEERDGNSKDLHEWGQDYGAFRTLVERLTRPGQLIVDPFAGAGTTLIAARNTGRHSIGAEISAEHVATAKRRLGID